MVRRHRRTVLGFSDRVTERPTGDGLEAPQHVPSHPPHNQSFVTQIVLLGLITQNLHLLRQAGDVCKSCRPAARTPAHEALLRAPMDGFRADVARLALRVLRARLRRDRDGGRVLLLA